MSRTIDPNETRPCDGLQPASGAPRRKPWVWPRCEILPFEETEKTAAAGPDGFGSLS